MYFNFCVCFFAWYSYTNYEFCNRIKNLSIAAVIKKYRLIIKKKKKKHDKRILLARSKLNIIKLFISEALFDSNCSHDEFTLINNVLKEYGDMKQEIQNLKT